EDGREALREVVMDIARQPVALLENGLAPLVESPLFRQAALMQGQRRLPRNGLAQDDAPPLRTAVRGVSARERDPSKRSAAKNERRDHNRVHARAMIEFPHRFGQAMIVAPV